MSIGYNFEMVYSELEDIVGEEHISVSQADKICYSTDFYWIPQMWIDKGCESPVADFIMHPGSKEEISKILVIANNYKIPVVPWGGGAGSQGGALPISGGIIMDMKRMNNILDVDEESLTVTVETGIIHQDLEWALNEMGYTTNHFPASMFCSTLGGFLAHRGSGVLSTKYGKIEDMVLSLEAVLPDGTIVNTLPVPRHAAGPDILQLLIGSEGTLGIITSTTLKIHRFPEERRFRAFLFKDLTSALNAGRNIMTERLRPTVIRLYDEPETRRLIKRVLGIDRHGSYLVFGFDGPKDEVELEEQKAVKICNREEGAEDLGSDLGMHWWNHKYDFYYPPHIFALPQAYGTLDTVATFSNIEKIYWAMKNAVESEFPGAVLLGHLSHWYDWGAMLYARFLFEDHPDDPHEAVMLYNRVWNTGVRAALAAGGVINEHHGIGLKLGRLMKEQYGPAYTVLQKMKKALDPNNIMNPGKMGLEGW